MYGTLEQANKYFKWHTFSKFWFNLEDTDKVELLEYATERLNELDFYLIGFKENEEQVNVFPRKVIVDSVKNSILHSYTNYVILPADKFVNEAIYEIAIFILLKQEGNEILALNEVGINEVSMDGVTNKTVMMGNVLLSSNAYEKIRKYLPTGGDYSDNIYR